MLLFYESLKTTPLPNPRQHQCSYKPRVRSLRRGAPCLTRTSILESCLQQNTRVESRYSRISVSGDVCPGTFYVSVCILWIMALG